MELRTRQSSDDEQGTQDDLEQPAAPIEICRWSRTSASTAGGPEPALTSASPRRNRVVVKADP